MCRPKHLPPVSYGVAAYCDLIGRRLSPPSGFWPKVEHLVLALMNRRGSTASFFVWYDSSAVSFTRAKPRPSPCLPTITQRLRFYYCVCIMATTLRTTPSRATTCGSGSLLSLSIAILEPRFVAAVLCFKVATPLMFQYVYTHPQSPESTPPIKLVYTNSSCYLDGPGPVRASAVLKGGLSPYWQPRHMEPRSCVRTH